MKKKPKGFFEIPEPWEEEWEGMPEFVQDDRAPFQTILVHFKDERDLKDFAKLVKQTVTERTKFIWYPKKKPENLLGYRYVDSGRKGCRRKN